MKAYIYIIVLTCAVNVFGQVSEAQGDHYGCKYLEEPNYIVNKKNVFFENCAIHRKVGVTPEDLVVIEKGLAYDNRHMIYNGLKLDVSPQNPTVLNTHIYTDRWSVYWTNAGRLYRNETEMSEIDTTSFVVFEEGYFKDKNHVYYKGKIMVNIDSETFVYNYPYSYDAKSVYLEGNERIMDGKLISINGYFFKDNTTVYEYNSNFSMDFKPIPNVRISDAKAIPKTKYGVVNDTLFYLGVATPYHHMDISKIKVFNDEVIGYEDNIIFRGYTTTALNYSRVQVIAKNDYSCRIQDEKGMYEMTIGRKKGKGDQVILSPVLHVKHIGQEPYRYTNITQLTISGDTLYKNDYPLTLKSVLTQKGVKNFDDIELVSALRGYRMGCSRDTQSASNYYILKNRQGYWELMISDEHTIKYIGKNYKF